MKPSPTLYDETPCTRRTPAHTLEQSLKEACKRLLSGLEQLLCVIPAIRPTVASHVKYSTLSNRRLSLLKL